MLALETPRAVQAAPRHASAVAWIEDASATVLTTVPDGSYKIEVVHLGPADKWDRSPYLARVVSAIGDRERVLILGPNWLRTELEREYVRIFHRPERLIDVEPAEASERENLLERLVTLAD